MVFLEKLLFNLAITRPVSMLYSKYQLGMLEKLRRFLFPFYEKEFKYLSALLKEHPEIVKMEQIKSNQLIIDIGGNTGQSAFALSRTFPKATIFCVEPNPIIQAALDKNKLKNWNIAKIALSDTVGEITLHTPVYKNIYFTGLTSNEVNIPRAVLNEKRIWNYKESFLNYYSFKTKTFTIDSLKLEPSLIKIDTEGMELEILSGAVATIKKSRPILIIECIGTFDPVKQYLHQFGYVALELGNDNHWQESKGNTINQVFLPEHS